MTYLVTASLAVLTVLVGGLTWHRTVSEPRRLSNAVWIGVSFLLAVTTVTMAGSPTLLGVAMAVMAVSPVLVLALVVFLVRNGVVMLRKEGRSLGNLLSLLGGLALAASVLACVLMIAVDAGSLPVAMWLVMSGGWVALLLFGFLGYSRLYQRLVRGKPADFVMVLGSGLIGERVPPLLAGRIDKGLEVREHLRAQGVDPVVVMSGGQGSDETVSEAEAMGRYALDRGLDPKHLLLEDRSTTTEQNLRFTRDLVHHLVAGGARGIAVTSDYHAMRAAMLARRLEVPVHVVGAPTARYFRPSAVLREFVAILRETWVWQVVAYALLVLPLPVMMAVAVWHG